MDYNKKENLEENTILKVITGSTMYGLSTENSDTDIKAVVKLPIEEFVSLREPWETTTFQNPDVEFHSLRKMMNLLSRQNITVLEMLYAEPEYILKATKEGQELIRNRELFLSQNCFNAFNGYAREQLIQIKKGLDVITLEDENEHLEFKLNEILDLEIEKNKGMKKENLSIKDFTKDSKGQTDVILHLKESEVPLRQMGVTLSQMNTHLMQHNKKGASRKKAEGNLFKRAMHFTRSIEEGVTLLETGVMKTSMKEKRDVMLALKQGELEWEEFFKEAKESLKRLEKAGKQTKLPKYTDQEKIEALYKRIQLGI